jgi:hypothetical protein
LLQLAPEQSEGVVDGLAKIYCASLLWCASRDAPQAAYEIVNSRYLLDHNLREVLSKVNVTETFGKKFGKCADCDKRILDLVSYAGRERTERSKAFGALFLSFKFLEAAEIAENDECAMGLSVFVLQLCSGIDQGHGKSVRTLEDSVELGV